MPNFGKGGMARTRLGDDDLDAAWSNRSHSGYKQVGLSDADEVRHRRLLDSEQY